MAIINGTSDSDWLEGTSGDDEIYGLGGNDSLQGNAGDDLLDGGPQAEFVDSAEYWNSPSGVSVNLQTGTASDGWGGTDTLVDIEGVTGSYFDDILIGDTGDNWFRPLAGSDWVDAGGGFDVLFYEDYPEPNSRRGVIVNLENGTADELDAAGDVLSSDTVLNFEALHGSYFDDILTLTNGSNYAFGRKGDDKIYGLDGDDNIYGGSGNDLIDGGAGTDTASYYDDGYDDVDLPASNLSQGVVVNLNLGTATDGWGDTDTLVSIENIAGSQLGDDITGDELANFLLGQRGADTINGLDGNDIIVGGSGADSLDGGVGLEDVVSYYEPHFIWSGDVPTSGQGVIVDLNAGTATDNWGDTDSISGFERVYGTTLDDTLIGDSAFNVLVGFEGNDTIIDHGSTLATASNGKAVGHGDDRPGQGKGHEEHGNGKGNGHDKHHQVAISEDNDAYVGGAGNDLFIFGATNGIDIITDFTAGAGSDDVIDISAWELTEFAELLALADDAGGTAGNTTITQSDDAIIILWNVQVTDLHADDFIL